MTTENKLSEAGQVRRNLLIFAGSMAVGILSTLETKYLFERFIPQEHEGGRADPGAMHKIIWGENCIYGFETWAEYFEGSVGGSMIYFSKLKGGEWLYTNVIEMAPDSFGKRPEISVLDATKGNSGAAYFMGETSAPVGYVDTKQGLVKDPSKIFVWGSFRGSTKVKYVTDFEGTSPSDNHKLFLDIVKTYDSTIRFD